ncbi:MAG: toast rack family protein [Anaerolineae bacterium]|nr:toast rack family protein [Anaerolineae bacterium]
MQKNKQRVIFIWLILAVALILSLGCAGMDLSHVGIEKVEIGEVQEERRVVELDDNDDVRVKVKLGAGDLLIEGGATELLEANFLYNIEAWRPEIEYTTRYLEVSQPTYRKMVFGKDVRYEWELRFNDNVRLDLSIDFGAGDAEIDLRHLAVTELDITIGAGEIIVDAKGNRTLERLDLDLGAGDVKLDLRGDWSEDVDVNIQGGIGRTAIRLPRDIGVRVDVTKGIGTVHADGFRIEDDAYVNELYEEAGVVLYLTVQAGVGEIYLELD